MSPTPRPEYPTMTTNAELTARRDAAVARGVGNIHNVYADTALWKVVVSSISPAASGCSTSGTAIPR